MRIDSNKLSHSKKELEYYEFDCSFTLKTAKKDHIKRLTKSGLKSITRSIYYPENLAAVKESTLLIDVQNTSQVGLSFRVFESLCYGKKNLSRQISIYRNMTSFTLTISSFGLVIIKRN